jgi:hypothetical protein
MELTGRSKLPITRGLSDDVSHLLYYNYTSSTYIRTVNGTLVATFLHLNIHPDRLPNKLGSAQLNASYSPQPPSRERGDLEAQTKIRERACLETKINKPRHEDVKHRVEPHAWIRQLTTSQNHHFFVPPFTKLESTMNSRPGTPPLHIAHHLTAMSLIQVVKKTGTSI